MECITLMDFKVNSKHWWSEIFVILFPSFFPLLPYPDLELWHIQGIVLQARKICPCKLEIAPNRRDRAERVCSRMHPYTIHIKATVVKKTTIFLNFLLKTRELLRFLYTLSSIINQGLLPTTNRFPIKNDPFVLTTSPHLRHSLW